MIFGHRRSGILLHPTSLPGPGGIGTLGPEALRFLDRLKGAGQTVWQVLPLGPTGYGDSPYQSFSAFAGNPYLISPSRLKDEGLVTQEDIDAMPAADAARVDFGGMPDASRRLLDAAWKRFRDLAEDAEIRAAFREFRKEEAAWLDDYTLFTAIHDEHDAAWVDWPEDLRNRKPAALKAAAKRHADARDRIAFAQFLFFRHWDATRARAAELGIEIMGDVPIFVAHDSCDVWLHRDLFDLDEDGRPLHLAGAPPDAFTDDGQLWGNPLYRWGELRKQGYAWWIDRVRAALRLYDSIRLDHFRGFIGCWSTPAGETTARNGHWEPVPGGELFDALKAALGDLPFVAEDLGDITPEVRELRARLGLPGMKILQFGFGGDPRTNEFAPHNYTRDFVVYTGTHDNETMQGWWNHGMHAYGRPKEEVEEERTRILRLTATDGSGIHWDFIRMALASVADTAILPMQDVLGLGNEARMNAPGLASGNWQWRMTDEGPDDAWKLLEELTGATGRWPKTEEEAPDSDTEET